MFCEQLESLNYKLLHPSGFIEVFESINKLNSSQIETLVNQVAIVTLVLFRDQTLSKRDLAELIRSVGETTKTDYFFSDKDFPDICHVTNAKGPKGEVLGVFSEKELGWHSNGNTRSDPGGDLLCLYCEEPGLGGDTFFSNNVKSYQSLSRDWKSLVDQVEITIQFDPDNNSTFYDLSEGDPEYEVFVGNVDKKRGRATSYGVVRRPLVATHPRSGLKSLYFCYPLISEMRLRNDPGAELNHLKNYLLKYMFTEQFVYHHKWRVGDLVLCDQWNSLHRRDPVLPGALRKLYRVVTQPHSKTVF
jgi:taurine dioxygenase